VTTVERFQNPGLQIEVAEIIIHEADQPGAVEEGKALIFGRRLWRCRRGLERELVDRPIIARAQRILGAADLTQVKLSRRARLQPDPRQDRNWAGSRSASMSSGG